MYLQSAAVKSSATLTTGKLLNSKDLDAYETLWHTRIFTPAWTALEKEVRVVVL